MLHTSIPNIFSSYERAHGWPIKMKKNNLPAVIIFEVNNDIFLDKKALLFNEPDAEWIEVVKFFRNKKKLEYLNDGNRNPSEVMAKSEELKALDYIFGPIGDGRNVRLRPTQLSNDMQLCIKTRAMADIFYNNGRNVNLTIFFCD